MTPPRRRNATLTNLVISRIKSGHVASSLF